MKTSAAAGIDYGPVRGTEEVAVHARNMAWSFHIAEDDLLVAFDRYGTDKLRVLRDAGRVVAGLSLLPLGQWYGGRRLAMAGISLVGVAPEHRGRGAATRMMEAVVREASEAGYPISVLYPAKQTLYRRVGYELAGGRHHVQVDVSDLEVGDRDLGVRPLEETDRKACEELYRRYAIEHNGLIDRPDFMWKRLVEPPGKRVRGFLVEVDGEVEAYAYAHQSEGEGHRHDLNLTDFVVRTKRAATRLLRFLGDHASLAQKVSWHGSPHDPVLALIPEQTWKERLFFRWMIRILDVVAALEGRGWPEGIDAELHLDIEDPILEKNRGRFVLEVSRGKGRVSRGGDGGIRADVRGLGAIYTGFLAPRDAPLTGLVSGSSAELRQAEAIFAGPSPWMSDMF